MKKLYDKIYTIYGETLIGVSSNGIDIKIILKENNENKEYVISNFEDKEINDIISMIEGE